MKKILFALPLLQFAQLSHAEWMDVFRTEDGHTNWQYVANTSASILIIALTLVIIRLFFSRTEARRYNRELEQIRSELESRVVERTATLDESNRQLLSTNEALENEISQHLDTTRKLRVSESYITDILRSMPLMLVGLDKDSKITQWNCRAEEISGVSAEQALGKNLWKTYPTVTVHPQQVKTAQEENRAITVKHCQRGQYHFDITIYPLGDEGETGVVVLIDDVTQQILAENMLIQRDKMSSMGELAATMAYDINSPLKVILDDISQVQETLEANNDNGPQSDLLTDALHRGQQVTAVIENLLDFSKSRGGKKKVCDITKIIDHTVELANDVLSEPSGRRFRDISILRKYADNLPKIPCYEAEMQQVFLSLFRHASNALNLAHDQEGFTPTIRIEVMEAYDNLWIKVAHNGLGLSLDEQQFIFEPFFNNNAQSDADPAKRLSFSHFIITEQHRGEMAITSDVNVGSTFHIQMQLT